MNVNPGYRICLDEQAPETRMSVTGRTKGRGSDGPKKEGNIMLGDLIGEFKGTITGKRVLEIQSSGPKVEISFKQTGKLLGLEAMDMATYWSIMTAPDVIYGEGQGVVKSMSGEAAMYRASGTAKMTKGPMPIWRGVLYFQSQTPKWSALNGVAIVYEYEIDEKENTSVKLWEWK